MFGYININREQLNEASIKVYQSYYCGLCQELKRRFGKKGQLLLNYDMTFLVLLLTGLYEEEDQEKDFFCGMHPTKKCHYRKNKITCYAADMNVLLSMGKFEDDWKDEHSHTKKALSQIFRKDYERIRRKYPRQERAVAEYLSRLALVEQEGETNVDVAAGLTGEMLGEIFAWQEDVWAEELKCLGFYMGKFIYLMDAYEDAPRDRKHQNYNVFNSMEYDTEESYETFCRLLLTSMMAECAKSFERLPILMHADLCRNILYSGVWTKYEYLRLKKQTKKKKKLSRTGKKDRSRKKDEKSL